MKLLQDCYGFSDLLLFSEMILGYGDTALLLKSSGDKVKP